jgi:hypothetical protein
MVVKGHNPFRFSRKLDRDKLLEKEILLHYSVRRMSAVFPDTSYYFCHVEDTDTGECGFITLGGMIVCQKLGMIDNLISVKPVPIKFIKVSPDKGNDYNDIVFPAPEEFDEYFSSVFDNWRQMLLPSVEPTEDSETNTAF